jgi:tetratricopeptide (TPR) repeat protein
VDASPTDFPSHLNLANAYYGMRSWARAQREYEAALQLIPQISIANTGSERPYVKYLIARAQHELRMYDKAVSTLDEALNLRPDFYWAQRLLAAAYSGQEQWRAAEEALRSALKSAPPDDFEKLADTHAHLGEVYEVQGRFHEAIAEYSVAQSYSPACLKATDGLRRLSAQEKRSAAVTQ